MGCLGCFPHVLALSSHRCLAHFHLTVQTGADAGGNWCKNDRVAHCQRNYASLTLVIGVKEHKGELGHFRINWISAQKNMMTVFASTCKSPNWPPTALSQFVNTYQMMAPLTMLNDAMLLQCTTQLQSSAPALRLSILKEPVNQLAARKGALIGDTMLFSQLQNGVFAHYETEEA